MSKKIYAFVLMFLLVPALMFGQTKQKAPLKVEPGVSVERTNGTVPYNPADWANYTLIDSMPNVYGPAISSLNPADYDPASGVLSIVYRGNTAFSAGSGELWYAYSTDLGETWQRSETSIEDGMIDIGARYPSHAISNPSGATDISEIIATFAWAELGADGFEFVGYGADLGYDGADIAGIYALEGSLFSSSAPIWAHDTEQYSFWIAADQEDADMHFFRTQDYSSVEEYVPDTWESADFDDGGWIEFGGVSFNGVQYVGTSGTFPLGHVGDGGWGIGYSKSTDNGDTWSEWNVVDWTQIPATAEYTELWDYVKEDEFVSYTGDIQVDANGYVHLVTGLTKIDSAVSAEYGYNAIVDFFETADGWDAKIVVEGEALVDSSFSQIDGIALGQMGPSPYIAMSPDRDFMAVQYVTGSPDSDYRYCDVYMNYRSLDGDYMPTSVNLTNTADQNENSSHFAPRLAKISDDQYKAFSFVVYPTAGVEDPDNPPLTDPTGYYFYGADITPSAVEGEPVVQVGDYSLEQNYPNPFNPTTRINFTIAKESEVSLVVYDVLGNKVATLVNGQLSSGQHTVNFDASNLTSGVYFYTLNAGEFTSTQKMMLLK